MKRNKINDSDVSEKEKQRYEKIFPMPDQSITTSVDLENNMRIIKKSLRKLARFIKALIK